MKSRIVAIGSWLFLSALYACGGDDSAPSETDAGIDGGGNVSGSGGKGGKGGSGGGGQAGNDNGGSGAQGGNGGEGGNGDDTYSVGGEVSGLNGTGLVIKLNDSEERDVSENGDFTFDTKLAKDADYTVTVKTQPTSPIQACSVKDGSGKVGESDVENVKIECSHVTRSVGGNVAGLGGGQIQLKNNGGDELTVAADGGFTFQTALQPGTDYAVTISSAPAGRTCNLTKGSGKTAGNNVTDVSISCYEGLALAAQARVASVGLSWNNNGASSYTVYLSTENCNFDNPDSCAGSAKRENVQSPYNWLGLQNGTVYYFNVRGSHPDDFKTRSSNEAGARPNSAEFDDIVHAITRGDDGTVYAGGEFLSVGPFTGVLAPLDRTTGRPSRIPNFPIFSRSSGSPVSSVVPDNAGGYFVGGTFAVTVAGGGTIENLAHVLANGTIDPTWNPAPNGNVAELALVGSTLYFSGTFTQLGAVTRPGLAAVSTTGAGALNTDWTPSLVPTGSVFNLVANSTGVYVAGSFTEIASVTRSQLAGLNLTTGALISNFPASPDNTVEALALASDTLYVSGNFDNIGGQVRYRLAGINLTSGAVLADLQLATTQPTPPTALAVAGDLLYLGGDFTEIRIGSNTTPRAHLAAVNRSTGALATWAPEADGVVRALAVSGDTIYAAGDFLKIGNTTRKYLAAIDAQGALTSWSPSPGTSVTGIAADSNTIYAFGTNLRSFGAESHEKLAAFKDGSLTTWGPAVSGGDVLSLASSGATTYVGGTFSMIGGVARNGVAAVSDANAIRDWNAQLNTGGEVRAIAVGSNRVYLGGSFNQGGGSARSNLVAVTTDSGAKPDSWTLTGVNGAVQALALDGADLYAGGEFDQVDASDNRDLLAKLNADTGAASSWNPGVDGTRVRALVVVGDNVVVGGNFTMLDGAAHHNLGAINKTTGAAVGWDGDLNDQVYALAKYESVVYVGGAFDTLEVTPTTINVPQFAVFNAANGFAPVTAFGTNGSVYALATDAGQVYLGGDTFSTVDTTRCWYFCSLERPLPPP